MNLTTQPYKGARDFYPEDKRLQKYMFNTLRRVAESFGYQEYDAPIIEPIELYLAKSSQEIVAEQTYNFLDRGGRHVTLRPEMTPSVSRMVAARRQELAYPLRLYSIPNLWRYERPQKGRLREHWQLNADLFGVASIEGDHEIILIADTIMKAFGAVDHMYEIRVSSRTLVNWLLMEHLGLEHDQAQALIRLIDRLDKLGEKEFLAAADALLTREQHDVGILQRLLSLIKTRRILDLPLEVQQHPAVEELSRLLLMLGGSGVESCVFDLGLMRGFDYYTNIVFEVYDKHPENNRSLFGGGRYDGLVGAFGVEPVPTVGFGMGDVTLRNFLEGHKLLPVLQPETDAVVVLVGDIYSQVQSLLADIRREHVRLAVDSTNRKLDSRIKAAVKSGIPYVIFIGEKELESGRLKLRELASGKEIEASPERIVSILAARRRNEIEEI